MHWVDLLFSGKTRLWLSDAAMGIVKSWFRKHRRDVEELLQKLEHCANAGFGLYEGEGRPIRREWGGVYRIGHRASLFRLIGFYEDDTKTDFIVIDGFKKRGQQLSQAERARIDEVARVKAQGLWRRRITDGN